MTGSLAALYVIWRAWKDRRRLRSPYGVWAKEPTIFVELRFRDRATPQLLTAQEAAAEAAGGPYHYRGTASDVAPPGPPDPPVPPLDRMYSDHDLTGRRYWIGETATGKVLESGVVGG